MFRKCQQLTGSLWTKYILFYIDQSKQGRYSVGFNLQKFTCSRIPKASIRNLYNIYFCRLFFFSSTSYLICTIFSVWQFSLNSIQPVESNNRWTWLYAFFKRNIHRGICLGLMWKHHHTDIVIPLPIRLNNWGKWTQHRDSISSFSPRNDLQFICHIFTLSTRLVRCNVLELSII